VHELRVHSRRGCALDHGFRQPSDAEQHIDSTTCHATAALAVHGLSRGTEFEHFACNHDAPPRWYLSQGTNHAVEGLWIGIVAIVDDGRARITEDLSTLVLCR